MKIIDFLISVHPSTITHEVKRDANSDNQYVFSVAKEKCLRLPFLDADGEQLLSAHYALIDATIRRKIQQGRFDEQYVSDAIERNLHLEMYSGRRLWELRGIIYGDYRNQLLNSQH